MKSLEKLFKNIGNCKAYFIPMFNDFQKPENIVLFNDFYKSFKTLSLSEEERSSPRTRTASRTTHKSSADLGRAPVQRQRYSTTTTIKTTTRQQQQRKTTNNIGLNQKNQMILFIKNQKNCIILYLILKMTRYLYSFILLESV